MDFDESEAKRLKEIESTDAKKGLDPELVAQFKRNREAICKAYGHHWVHIKSPGTKCQRCGVKI